MASEHPQATDRNEPLEEKIADLHLQDEEDGTDTDSAKDATNISSTGAKDVSGECKDGESLNQTGNEGGKPSEEPVFNERDLAKDEVAKSADEGAYHVPTVEHRSLAGQGGEEKTVDIPTAVVHENADTVGKEQQGKGIVGKISSSVKSIFSGLTGSKAAKNSEDAQK